MKRKVTDKVGTRLQVSRCTIKRGGSRKVGGGGGGRWEGGGNIVKVMYSRTSLILTPY